MLTNIPDEWGYKYQSGSTAITYTCTGPNNISYDATHDSALILLTAQPHREMALNSDKMNSGLASAGSLEIFPRLSSVRAKWQVPKQTVLVSLDQQRLKNLAISEFDCDRFEFHPPSLGVVDELSHLLAQSMKNEIDHGVFGFSEYVDALVTVLYGHLLRNYSSLKPTPVRHIRGGLSPAIRRKIQDYIHAHITTPLTLETLASIAKLSPSHFSRAFKQSTGQSPHHHVILTRLTMASEQIRCTSLPLNEIAIENGFSSQSHMTSIMKRLWGITPADYRRNSR